MKYNFKNVIMKTVTKENKFCGKENKMFGFSIFLDKDLTEETLDYVGKLARTGFEGIFTSIHIPEIASDEYRERLISLGKVAKSQGLPLMVDISGNALEKIGFSFERLQELADFGITGLRMDYQVSVRQIAKASQTMTVSLNASTLTLQEIEALRVERANFSHLEAWHNYYPRPETALSEQVFCEKNQFLKANGFKVVAFANGDENLRLPLRCGLPTLEQQRGEHPLAAALGLLSLGADDVYIGDAGLSPHVIEQFYSYLKADTIKFFAQNHHHSSYFEYILRTHTERQDAARDVLRSAEARFWKIPHIEPEHTDLRTRGAITIDNERYLRYMGEIQICKRALPQDEKVNVVGFVCDKDMDLLEFVRPGQKFEIKNGDENA